MKRIVWIAAAMLIMVGILGLGLHAINDIDKKNKEYRQQKEGEKVASMVAVVTETTSIWDRLRTTETAESGVMLVVPEGGEEQQAPETPVENEPVVPDAPEQTPEQTNTVVNNVIVVE